MSVAHETNSAVHSRGLLVKCASRSQLKILNAILSDDPVRLSPRLPGRLLVPPDMHYTAYSWCGVQPVLREHAVGRECDVATAAQLHHQPVHSATRTVGTTELREHSQ